MVYDQLVEIRPEAKEVFHTKTWEEALKNNPYSPLISLQDRYRTTYGWLINNKPDFLMDNNRRFLEKKNELQKQKSKVYQKKLTKVTLHIKQELIRSKNSQRITATLLHAKLSNSFPKVYSSIPMIKRKSIISTIAETEEEFSVRKKSI
jgi:hypothetical protein